MQTSSARFDSNDGRRRQSVQCADADADVAKQHPERQMLRLPRDNTALNWTLPTIRGAVQRNDLIISIFHFQFAIPLSIVPLTSVSEIHLLHT